MTCVTCGSRLKVPDRRLIGSIESCPKCGAMVQIIAPQDAVTGPSGLPLPPNDDAGLDRLTLGEQSAIDSSAITQSAIRGAMPPSVKSSELNSGGPTFDSSVDETDRTTPPPPQEPPADEATRGTSAAEADEYRREIDGVWQSEATQRKKQLVLVAMLSLFGLVTAGVVFSQFVRTWRKQQSLSQTSSEAEENASSPDEEPPADSSEQVVAPPSVTTPDASVDAVDQPPAIVSDTSPKTVETREEIPTQESTNTKPNTAPVPTMVPPLETGVIVGGRDDAAIKPGDANTPDPSPMKDLPPGLAQFLPMANLLTSDNQTAAPIEPPPTIDTVRIEEAAMAAEPEIDPTLNRKVIDVEKALAQRFAIDNQGISFSDLMLVVSALTTVPVELELIAFDAAGIQVDAPVKTPSGWMSSKQWIDETCAGLGLVSTTNDGRIMISIQEARLDAELAPAFLLDDFGDQSRALFAWISPLLNELDQKAVAPTVEGEIEGESPIVSATKLSEDGTTIVPGASLRSKMHALFAVESARMIRGMPTKLERWRTARWMGPWNDTHDPSDTKTIGDWPVISQGKEVPVFDSPQSAAGLLRLIATINSASLLVEWFDATNQGFYPADPMMPFSRDSASGAVLGEMLGEFGLQTRVCSPALWYVCSDPSYDRFEVFAWYTIPTGSGEAVRQRLANSLSVDPNTLPIVFTDTTLLIRCPRYIARQMSRIIPTP